MGELNKNRCQIKSCKKKLNIIDMSMQCQCGKCFCSNHRLPELHNCESYNKDAPKLERIAPDKLPDRL